MCRLPLTCLHWDTDQDEEPCPGRGVKVRLIYEMILVVVSRVRVRVRVLLVSMVGVLLIYKANQNIPLIVTGYESCL